MHNTAGSVFPFTKFLARSTTFLHPTAPWSGHKWLFTLSLIAAYANGQKMIERSADGFFVLNSPTHFIQTVPDLDCNCILINSYACLLCINSTCNLVNIRNTCVFFEHLVSWYSFSMLIILAVHIATDSDRIKFFKTCSPYLFTDSGLI